MGDMATIDDPRPADVRDELTGRSTVGRRRRGFQIDHVRHGAHDVVDELGIRATEQGHVELGEQLLPQPPLAPAVVAIVFQPHAAAPRFRSPKAILSDLFQADSRAPAILGNELHARSLKNRL